MEVDGEYASCGRRRVIRVVQPDIPSVEKVHRPAVQVPLVLLSDLVRPADGRLDDVANAAEDRGVPGRQGPRGLVERPEDLGGGEAARGGLLVKGAGGGVKGVENWVLGLAVGVDEPRVPEGRGGAGGGRGVEVVVGEEGRVRTEAALPSMSHRP